MGDSAYMELDGIGDLMESVELYAAAPEKVADVALKEAGEPIAEEAKQTSAFVDRSGKLRKSIGESGVKYEYRQSGSIKGRKYILVGSADRVAHLVEYGHGGPQPAPAHPFLEPAFNHHKDEAEAIIKARLREALNSG